MYDDKKNKQNLLLKMMFDIDKILLENNLWYTLSHGSLLGAVRHSGFIPWDDDLDICIKIIDRNKALELLNENLNDEYEILRFDYDLKYYSAHDRVALKKYPNEEIHIDIYSLIGSPNSKLKRSFFTILNYITYTYLSSKYKKLKYSKSKHILLRGIFKVLSFWVPDKLIKKIYTSMALKYNFHESNSYVIIESGFGEKNIMSASFFTNIIRTPFEHYEFNIIEKYDEYLKKMYGNYMVPK